MRSSDRGFTLLEIIIVAVLLPLLVGMAAVRLVQRADSTKRRIAETIIKGTLTQALQQFYLDNDFYPTSQQGLAALVEKPTGVPDPTHYDEEGYLEEVPLDPWGMPYQYACPGTHNPRRFDLWSMGRDRQTGTDDDIVNWRTR